MGNKTEKEKSEQYQEQQPVQEKSKNCFVIMPIGDTDGYEPGHFDRVYDYLIKPACIKAGIIPRRADKTSKANHIVIDILKQVVNSDIAICDLSSRNSNVFFELGLRQAFNLKTVLIKDSETPNSFDIADLRYIEYKASLRIDEVQACVEKIAQSLADTMDGKSDEVYSLIQLLSIESPAKLSEPVKLNNDTSYILNEIKQLREEIQRSLHRYTFSPIFRQEGTNFSLKLPNGELANLGDTLYQIDDSSPFNETFGTLVDFRNGRAHIQLQNSERIIVLNEKSPEWRKLTLKDTSLNFD